MVINLEIAPQSAILSVLESYDQLPPRHEEDGDSFLISNCFTSTKPNFVFVPDRDDKAERPGGFLWNTLTGEMAYSRSVDLNTFTPVLTEVEVEFNRESRDNIWWLREYLRALQGRKVDLPF